MPQPTPANFDQSELNKFADLASHWWDTEGDLKTLHQINPLRLAYIMKKVRVAQCRVLDIGCGGGILTESLAEAGAIVTGIDLNSALIQVAELHQLESGTTATYAAESAEAFATKHPESFDVITCLELLEHVPNPKSIIEACAALLKPKGHVFFSTINRNMKAYLLAILGAEYCLKLLPRGTHDFSKFITPSELSSWMRACRLSVESTQGIHYNPLTKIFSLSPDISVNYIIYGQKN